MKVEQARTSHVLDLNHYHLSLQFEPLLFANMESVVLETSLGDIQLELYWEHAPKVCLSLHASEKLDGTYTSPFA